MAQTVADYLDRNAPEIASSVTKRMVDRYPELFDRYRESRRTSREPEEWCREDTIHHIDHLKEALLIDDESDFAEYRAWLVRMLGARGISETDVDSNFEILAEVLEERFGDEAVTAVTMLRAG